MSVIKYDLHHCVMAPNNKVTTVVQGNIARVQFGLHMVTGGARYVKCVATATAFVLAKSDINGPQQVLELRDARLFAEW